MVPASGGSVQGVGTDVGSLLKDLPRHFLNLLIQVFWSICERRKVILLQYGSTNRSGKYVFTQVSAPLGWSTQGPLGPQSYVGRPFVVSGSQKDHFTTFHHVSFLQGSRAAGLGSTVTGYYHISIKNGPFHHNWQQGQGSSDCHFKENLAIFQNVDKQLRQRKNISDWQPGLK